MKFIYNSYIILLFALLTISCDDKENAVQPDEKGTLTLHFDNIVGDDSDLTLESGVYVNASDESFSITTLKYFISNIKLKTTDGKEFVVPQDSSYFLVDEGDEESEDIELKDIPAGDYNAVTFT